MAQLRRLFTRLHVLQIDAVNVLIRTQYLPAFSRLGAYPVAALDTMAYGRHELFETNAHAACLVPLELHPLLRWRMAAMANNPRWLAAIPAGYAESIVRQVAERGPLTPPELDEPGVRPGKGMWDRSGGKAVMEWLTESGVLAISGRRNLEQVYDLAERVIPADILARPTPDPEDARRELLLRGAAALGVGTAKDIADYFRIRNTASLFKDLAASGELVPVSVEGWRQPAFLHPSAKAPKTVSARALLSPFDSLIWERERTERLFDFRYRIEIYVRPPERVYGYYVLPFLLGESLVARVDLKSDRAGSALLVQSAFIEEGASARVVAPELAAELRVMADWLGLERIVVGERGDLATALRSAVKRLR